MDEMLGRVLGQCELVALLGRGGMGAVYRGVHRSLKQPRAVKVLRADLATEPDVVERFYREAMISASLHHPNIVLIYDVGNDDGLQFLVMDLLEGVTLRQLISTSAPLPVERTVHLLGQLANALDYAHGRGIVHRDIKPGNVMVGAEDRVTLVDFGIARAADEARLTRSGMVVGTAEYMAPEAFSSGGSDQSGDRYALGILAYELLTGRVPFRGNPTAVSYSHVHAPPPTPRSLNPQLPDAVERVLIRQIAKQAADRYPDSRSFVAALAAAVQASGHEARTIDSNAITYPPPRPIRGPAPPPPGYDAGDPTILPDSPPRPYGAPNSAGRPEPPPGPHGAPPSPPPHVTQPIPPTAPPRGGYGAAPPQGPPGQYGAPGASSAAGGMGAPGSYGPPGAAPGPGTAFYETVRNEGAGAPHGANVRLIAFVVVVLAIVVVGSLLVWQLTAGSSEVAQGTPSPYSTPYSTPYGAAAAPATPAPAATVAPAAQPTSPAPPAPAGAGGAPPAVAAVPAPPQAAPSAPPPPAAAPPPPTSAPAPVPTTAPAAPAATAAPSDPPAASAAASPAPGPTFAVVLDERFATNARGWPSAPNGTAFVTDGEYHLFVRTPGQFVSVGAPGLGAFGDVEVTGRFRKVDGPPGGGFGLIVRDQGPDPRDGVNQGGRYYVLEVGEGRQWGMWRRETDRWVDLQPFIPSDAVRPPPETNELTARAIGSHLIFIVNGTQVADIEDATLGNGKVGIYVAGDGNVVEAEQFVVRAPR